MAVHVNILIHCVKKTNAEVLRLCRDMDKVAFSSHFKGLLANVYPNVYLVGQN